MDVAPLGLGVGARIPLPRQAVCVRSWPGQTHGLALHSVYLDTCHNYWIRLWELGNSLHVVWGREVNDHERWIISATLPSCLNLGLWYDYRVDVLPANRLKLYWNGTLIFDATDPEHTFSEGPVGMRLDYFDTNRDETRVYQP
jgi:hypothetical protein